MLLKACVVVLWDWYDECMQQDQRPVGFTLHCSCKSCTPVRHRHCIVCTSQHCVYPTSINTQCWPACWAIWHPLPLVCWYLCAARCAACFIVVVVCSRLQTRHCGRWACVQRAHSVLVSCHCTPVSGVCQLWLPAVTCKANEQHADCAQMKYVAEATEASKRLFTARSNTAASHNKG